VARARRSSRIIHITLLGGDRKAQAKRDSPDVHVPPLGHPTARFANAQADASVSIDDRNRGRKPAAG
jgi:hypothetical protein